MTKPNQADVPFTPVAQREPRNRRLQPEQCQGRKNHGRSRGVKWVFFPAIRTVQHLPGHGSVETTPIYPPVMQKPGLGARSPLDARSRPVLPTGGATQWRGRDRTVTGGATYENGRGSGEGAAVAG